MRDEMKKLLAVMLCLAMVFASQPVKMIRVTGTRKR